MSWSYSSQESQYRDDAAEAVKKHQVSSDNKAQELGHVGKVKDLVLRTLEKLPENARCRVSMGGHTDNEDTWQGSANVQFTIGYDKTS